MSFRKTTKDERDEWRRMPMTILALQALREHVNDAQRGVLNAASGGDEREVRLASGYHKGLADALAILSEEDK